VTSSAALSFVGFVYHVASHKITSAKLFWDQQLFFKIFDADITVFRIMEYHNIGDYLIFFVLGLWNTKALSCVGISKSSCVSLFNLWFTVSQNYSDFFLQLFCE